MEGASSHSGQHLPLRALGQVGSKLNNITPVPNNKGTGHGGLQSVSKHNVRSCKLSLLYYNACSILPKMDLLCAVTEADNPDIVCIVETWLDTNIPDQDIGLPGYRVYRRDRNRHGGGVLIYVKLIFVTSLYPSPDNLELLTLSVSNNVNKAYISLFYRPPNSPVDIYS